MRSDVRLLALFLLSASAQAGEEGSRFLHQTHQDIGKKLHCDECHKVTPTMQPTFPGADEHKPCAGCHQHKEAFATRNSPLCLTCHEHSDPWRKNPYLKRPREKSEFHVAFSHASHLGRAKKGKFLGEGCAACHFEEAGREAPKPTPERPAPFHELCGQCHAENNKPTMRECDACHRLGPGPSEAAASPWAVGPRFTHEGHREDPRDKQPTACETCHRGMAAVEVGQPAVNPKMSECATCHDGAVAFKTTGFECARCHGAAVEGAP